MPLESREFSEWCDRPAQDCVAYPDCAHCPYREGAKKLKELAEKKEKEAE